MSHEKSYHWAQEERAEYLHSKRAQNGRRSCWTEKRVEENSQRNLTTGKISHEAVRCPVEMATERYTCEEITIAQTPIPRGELVMAVIGSANRDANAFDHPDLLDITRKNNKHLAFGDGAHFCLGVSLAQLLEGQIAISTLI